MKKQLKLITMVLISVTNMQIIKILIVSLFPTLLFGVVGVTETDKKSELNSVCRILFFDTAENLQSICTGNLTKSDEITTADHCTEGFSNKNLTSDIRCGFTGIDRDKIQYQKTKRGTLVMTKGPIFKERAEVKVVMVSKTLEQDKAIIKLSKKLNIKPTASINSKNISELYVKDSNMLKYDVECMIAGFGLNQSLIAGELNYITIHPWSIHDYGQQLAFLDKVKPSEDSGVRCSLKGMYSSIKKSRERGLDDLGKHVADLFKYLGVNNLTNGSIQLGDSGGPLFCRANKSSPWIQLGITSIIYAYEQTRAPIRPPLIEPAFEFDIEDDELPIIEYDIDDDEPPIFEYIIEDDELPTIEYIIEDDELPIIEYDIDDEIPEIDAGPNVTKLETDYMYGNYFFDLKEEVKLKEIECLSK